MTFNPVNGNIAGAGDVALSNPVNNHVLSFNQSVQKWVNAPASNMLIANTATNNYTLALTDSGKVVEVDAPTTATVTVPTNASVAFPVGTIIKVAQHGIGPVVITGASGVTVLSANGENGISVRYAEAELRKRATNEWVLTGTIATVSTAVPITVQLSATSGDGTATLQWTVNPGSYTVDGIYAGRDGTSSTGGGPWEAALSANLNGSQNFTNLLNNTVYTLYIQLSVGGARGDVHEVTVTPAAAPTGGATKPLIGQYRGNPNENPDQSYQPIYGAYPELTSTYITTQNINETYESARLARGTSVFLDLDSKNTAGLISEVANETTAGMNYINTFLAAAQRVAASSTNAKVYVAYVHEWEVKVAQNVLKHSEDIKPAVYGKAHSVFNRRAGEIAPDCIPIYWTGAFSGHRTMIASVMAAMTVYPEGVAYDTYVTDNGAFESAVSDWDDHANWLRANSSYQAWGSPALWLGEFGIDGFHGDAKCASFYTGLRDSMRTIGLSGAIHFNRNKTDNDGQVVRYKIDDGSLPQTLTAFKNSLLDN